ncbi:hypothetical protein C0991_003814 [Blastosporella zonata]|nr:hypothetical protein C0991_003814 [Blastosporella zonata]
MTGPVLQPSPSPNSSASDNGNAFNTADARIHFGPLTSPEKRLSTIVPHHTTLHSASHSLFLRRSPRLSSPQPQSPQPNSREEPAQIIEESVVVPLSREWTPDVEQALQDEPPSALAIKISRAHDNPSPPPSPPPGLGSGDLAAPSPRLPFPSLTAALLRSVNASDTEGSTPPISSSVTPGMSRNASPALTTASASQKTSQSDLISFEYFPTPAAVFRATSPSLAQSLSSSLNPSVDDLFSQSPTRPRSPNSIEPQENSTPVFPIVVSEASDGENVPEEGKAACSTVQERGEEQAVRDSLILPEGDAHSRDAQPLSPNTLDDAARTPTRHSSRSHFSTTQPHGQGELVTPSSRPKERSGQQSEPGELKDDKEENMAGTEEDQDINSTPKSVFLRELGSLSPTSNDLLSSLVAPPSRQPLPFSFTIPTITHTTNSTRRLFPSSSSQGVPQTPLRSTSPVRFASPSRPGGRDSSNIRLQPMSLDDPSCTPARRIPIGEAIAQGHVSPLKGSQLLASSSRSGLDGVQNPPLIIPPTDSPARRVLTAPELATPAAQNKWQGIRFGSPTRNASKERFSSTEPAPVGNSKGKSRERDGSVPLATSTSSSSYSRPSTHKLSTTRETQKSAKLPFPLVPSMPTTIFEEHQADADTTMFSPNKPSQVMFSSPVKSSLKQTTSRIPRTVKPYAKPTLKPQAEGKSTMRTIIPAMEASKSVPISGASTSGAAHSGEAKAKAASKPVKVESHPATLKRKRMVVEKTSPVKPRPQVMMLRQVPRVVIPTAPYISKPSSLFAVGIQNKPQQIRRVIDKPLDLGAGPSTQPTLSAPQQKALLVPEIEVLDVDAVGSDDQESTMGEIDNKTLSPSPSPSPSPDPIADIIAPPEDGVRRTTRVRKVLNPSLMTDAFGSSDVKQRRKPNAQSNLRNVSYSGMSATALRALTTSNTVRNQRYAAAKLKTQVIKREGDRPESPAVKIKTVSQREQDEKGRERKRRAARRARLSGEGVGKLSDEDGRSNSGSEDESDWSSPPPERHKRGPGDEEDYKTPVRRFKRLKLGDGNDTEESAENERRVKWDRGLFTTIYLDQVKLGTRRPPKENIATKGCLAPTAKTLNLDKLGNLPYADSPLIDLVEENVVVKKFVYDNDEPVEEVVVVKNTRTRSKKGKS